jgi:hypothetical protein
VHTVRHVAASLSNTRQFTAAGFGGSINVPTGGLKPLSTA